MIISSGRVSVGFEPCGIPYLEGLLLGFIIMG
jgi:hypothetical protein